jgi:adhesin/invasin
VEATAATAFRVAAPSVVGPGQPFALTVTAVDAWGNTATTYHGTVHFSSTDLGAQLPDDYTFAAADGGVQTFVASLATPGQQTVSVQDVSSAALGLDLAVFVDGASDPQAANAGHRHGIR